MNLSFECEPDNKLFFLGALAGIARAGVARAGVSKVRPTIPHRPPTAAPVKSLGGLTVSPSSQKTENNSTTITNDHSINSTVINNK